MPSLKGASFKDRQEASVSARLALVEKFKARPKADDPVVIEMEAKRRAIAEARAARIAERERERAIRQAAEKAEREAREKAEAEAAEKTRVETEAAAIKAKHEEAELKIMLEAEKKAERDARYAARKARKKERKQEIDRRY